MPADLTAALFSPWSYASRHPFITAAIIIALIALVALQGWFTRRYAPKQWALSLILGAGYLAFAVPGMHSLFEEHPSELGSALESAAKSAELCQAVSQSQVPQALTPERAAAIVDALKKYYEANPHERK